jgi:hypothetical protein
MVNNDAWKHHGMPFQWAEVAAFLDDGQGSLGVELTDGTVHTLSEEAYAWAEEEYYCWRYESGAYLEPEEVPGSSIPVATEDEYMAAMMDRPKEDFTCHGCGLVNNCRYAWDLYNTDGDCLADK